MILYSIGQFFKGFGLKNTAIALMVVVAIGGIAFLMIRVQTQSKTIQELEDRIETYKEAGDTAIPQYTQPWDDFTLSTPTETPTERSYDDTVNEYRQELEDMQDEELFTAHGDAEHRDRVVGGYASALRSAINSQLDS